MTDTERLDWIAEHVFAIRAYTNRIGIKWFDDDGNERNLISPDSDNWPNALRAVVDMAANR